jgi:hypothetical protein
MSREDGQAHHPMETSQHQEIIPNYRRPYKAPENPHFAGPNYERRAETIHQTLAQLDQLIANVDDNLESAYRNSFLGLLIGMKSSLMDEHNRLARNEWGDSGNHVGSTELHPATLNQFEKALDSWNLEIRPKPQQRRIGNYPPKRIPPFPERDPYAEHLDSAEKQHRIEILRGNLQGYRDRLEEIDREMKERAEESPTLDLGDFRHEQKDIQEDQRKDELRLLILENPEEAKRRNALDLI